MNLITFNDALDLANSITTSRGNPVKRHLLLGNGFSIALKPDIFTYSSLFETADFSSTPHLTDIFSQFGTRDFEQVIQALDNAATLIPYYSDDDLDVRMRSDAQRIKEVLIETIAGNHPPRPFEINDDQYTSCKAFLNHFLGNNGEIYTLNYDILLYWVLMQSEIRFDDGFRPDPDNPDADYVSWSDDIAHRQNVYYVHGALHLFDAGYQLRKYTWNRTDIPLIEQTRDAISSGDFPLFVSEGSSQHKLEKISHSGYLHRAYKRLSDIKGCMFTLGWSLADNDSHILRKIMNGGIKNLFIGLHGDPDSETNQQIITRASQDSAVRSGAIEVKYYDSATANVWNT